MKYLVFLLLFFISINATSQVMQTTGGAGGNKFRALKADSFLVVPKGADTANLANPKWGESTTGALFVKTTDSTLWFKVGGQWVQAGGNFTQTVIGNDTTIYEFVIDSTGAAANRVLFAGAKKIRSDSHFLWDSVNNKLVINHFNHSIGGVNTKLYVNGNANLNGSATSQQFRVSQIQQVFNDTTNYKPVIVNSSGDLYKLDRWPAGGGGSGTVTSVATNTATGITGGTITTSGTLAIDTTIVSTRAWRDKLADSLAAIIATKGSGTVTNFSAGDLSPLFTTSEATTTTTPALSFSLSNAGSYTVFGNQTNASAAPSFAKLNINTIDATGTPSATTYLRGDGSWASVSSGGIPIDSVAIRRIPQGSFNHYVGFNSGPGSTGTSGGNVTTDAADAEANMVWGRDAAKSLRTSGRFDGNNFLIGREAGEWVTNSAYNIAIGFRTVGGINSSLADSLWTSTGTGGTHIGIGYRALGSIKGGDNQSRNIAIGYNAMDAYTGCAGCTSSQIAIGQDALGSLTTGVSNIGIGTFAVFGPTTGSQNVGIGASTIQAGNGSNNTAIGWNALGGGSFSGSNNTAIGYTAMSAATSADNNVAIGLNADYSLTTGDYNVAIGSGVFNQGARSATTGTYNLAIMELSQAASSGSYNIAIGQNIQSMSLTNSSQLNIGGNGVRWITSDVSGSGRRWLLNATTSNVTSMTASAALEINGTLGAVLFPRLTTTQRDALTATNGMVIYNSTTDKLQVYAAGAWTDLH